MAKLTKKEIDALVAETKREQVKKNEEYRNSINFDDFDDELAIIRAIERLEEQYEKLYCVVQDYHNVINKIKDENNIPDCYSAEKEVRRRRYLLSIGLIQKDNVIDTQELENFFIINNNGDSGQLLELAKKIFVK